MKSGRGMGAAEPLPPGSRIGIVGGGQLGRMTAMAAAHMGFRVSVFDPDPDAPAAQVADDHIAADYGDRDAARLLGCRSDVATYEFENVDAAAIEAVQTLAPVHPSSAVLRVAQERVAEKGTLSAAGFPVAPYRPVTTRAGLSAAVADVGLPAVLKTARMGYDGKGQVVLRSGDDLDGALPDFTGAAEFVLEQFVTFERELSVICARDLAGNVRTFPCAENIHEGGILDVSIVPARVPGKVASDAADLAAAIAEHLGVVGLLAVEMFLIEDGRLLVNELAPRPHNSGHYTMEGCMTSQFEQLVRVLCNLPLGETTLHRPAVMVNLLGDMWPPSGGEPDFAGALAEPGVSLHLYGKSGVRPGRKMGHMTALASDSETALARALGARRLATENQG